MDLDDEIKATRARHHEPQTDAAIRSLWLLLTTGLATDDVLTRHAQRMIKLHNLSWVTIEMFVTPIDDRRPLINSKLVEPCLLFSGPKTDKILHVKFCITVQSDAQSFSRVLLEGNVGYAAVKPITLKMLYESLAQCKP